MKDRILTNLKKLRNPSALKYNSYSRYLEEAIDYIKRSKEPPEEIINIRWLQKRITDDMLVGKCDGLVLRKVNNYIYLYQKEKGIDG